MVTKMRKECDVVEYNGKCLQWINGNNVEYPWSYRCDEGYYKLNSSWCWQPGFEMKNMKGTQRFYENGTHWELGYVGLYTPTSSNRVVRYSFTTGSDFTASSVRVWFRPWGLNEGVADNLRFHITKDSESHKNANSSSVYSGVLSQTSPEFRDKPLLVGNANVSLEPNSTYYLYVYGVKTHGWWNWDFADYDSVALITFLTK